MADRELLRAIARVESLNPQWQLRGHLEILFETKDAIRIVFSSHYHDVEAWYVSQYRKGEYPAQWVSFVSIMREVGRGAGTINYDEIYYKLFFEKKVCLYNRYGSPERGYRAVDSESCHYVREYVERIETALTETRSRESQAAKDRFWGK